jgi:hypothetical protein
MRKLWILIGLFVLTGCVKTGEYYIKTTVPPKEKILNIAVIPENWDEWWATSFSSRAIITELIDAGFTVVERSNLVTILKEQKLQHSGVVKDGVTEDKKLEGTIDINPLERTTIKKLGEVLGVDALLLVYVVPHGREIHMATFRLVDVETAKVLTSTTIMTLTGVDVDIVMKQAAIDIMNALVGKKRIVRDGLFKIADTTKNDRSKGDDILYDKNIIKEAVTIKEIYNDEKIYNGRTVILTGFVNNII